MNYLAHLVLSQPHADSYFGNLLGDFRRGVKVTAFSESVQAGVTNHLLVDKFTDSHPAVIAAKQQVSTQRRRFAGILLDVCFDHFLLVHWQRFLVTPVSQFTEHAYSNLSANLPDMPATMQRMVSSMVTDRWLDSYDDMAQLNVVLERTASRIRFKHHFHGSIEEVERHYDTFESAFLSLFPDLLQYIQHNGPEPGVAVEVLGP